MEAVAARAGVAKGLVFHHFGSKADLYTVAVTDAARRVVDFILRSQDLDEPDLFQRLWAWNRRELALLGECPGLYRLAMAAFAQVPEPSRHSADRTLDRAGADQPLLAGLDAGRFRRQIQPDEAIGLVMGVPKAPVGRLLLRLQGEPDAGLTHLSQAAERVRVCLAPLRDGCGKPVSSNSSRR